LAPQQVEDLESQKKGANGEKIGLFTELPIPIIKRIYSPQFYYKDFIAA